MQSPDIADEAAHLLEQLEVELHHPGSCTERKRLEELLHEDFHEIGRSGRRYDRETVIRFLLERKVAPRTESGGFKAERLAPRMMLLTYRSVEQDDEGNAIHPAWRSSLWMQADGGWKLRYHQATPALPDPVPDPASGEAQSRA